MFKCAAVFSVLLPGLALAAEHEPPCLAEMVNAHQVVVTGEYGGKSFAFTITSQSSLRPGQKPKPEQQADQACPMTS